MSTAPPGTCPNCGKPLAPGARFCPSCGFTLPQGAQPVTPATPPAPAAPSSPTAPPPATAYGPPAPGNQAPQQPYADQYYRPAGAYAGYQQAPAGYVPGAAQSPFAYPVAAPYYAAQTVPRKTGRGGLWALLVAGLLAFMVVLGSIAYVAGPRRHENNTCKGTNCRVPPSLSPPLPAPNVYTSTAFGYSVAYYDIPELGSAFKVVGQDDKSISWTVLGWPVTIAGQAAGSQGADAIIEAIQRDKFPDAQKAYSVPGMVMGVTPGTANLYDLTVKSPTGKSVKARLAIGAAIKNGVALTIVALGPFRPSTHPPEGHPNPSETWMTNIGDRLIKNVTFKGDTPL